MTHSRFAWVTFIVLVAAWAVLGTQFDTDAWVVHPLSQWVTVIAAVAPLVFILTCSALSFLGGNKWWTTNIGVNLIWMQLCALCSNGLLAWAVLFHGGLINQPPTAWAYLGGLLASAIIITWRSLIFISADRHRRAKEQEAAVTQ